MGRSNSDFAQGTDRPVYHGSEGLAGGYNNPLRWDTHALSERNTPEAAKEPGAKWGSDVALVPVSQLMQYREYHRASGVPSQALDRSKSTISSIAKDLKEGGVNALREPIWVDYDHRKKWGYISEGNHRLEAAAQAGLTHVPVRCGRAGVPEGHKEKGIGAPLHIDARIVEQGGSYIPSRIHPGNFQEFEGAR